MATLLHLAELDQLLKLEPSLAPGQQPLRLMYLYPRAKIWMDTVLPGLPSLYESEVTPIEQLDAFFGTYCAGDELMYERQFRPLRHIDKGIWELKTRDLRLFGWFHKRDCFVCSAVDDATRVKDKNLYNGYRDQAAHDRDTLDLDEPKFVPGDDPNDVISAFSYPT